MMMRVLLGVVVLSCVAGGCKKEAGKTADPVLAKLPELVAKPAAFDPAKLSAPALFAHVPADTPYMIGAFEAIPLDYYAKVQRAIGPALDRAFYRFREVVEDDRFDRLSTALLEELDGSWSAAALEKLGFSASPRFAFYGLGVQPGVFRIEVKDDKAVLATVERIARKAEMTLPPPQTMDGRPFWRVPVDGDAAVVIALADSQLVFAFGRAAEVDRHLGLILGTEKPAQSMAGGKVLSDIMTTHGFGPHMIAFADTKLIAKHALASAGRTVSSACASEIDRVSGRVPRAVFGYSRLDTGVSSGGFVLELAPDLVTELAALKTEVPGLSEGVAGQPLFAFGGGLDLARGQELGKAAGAALKKLGEACELGEMMEAGDELAAAMSKPLPAPVQTITGFLMVAQDLAFGGTSPMPEKLEAFGAVTSTNAKQLFDSFLQLQPMLGQLGIKADGQLHALSGLPIPMKILGGVGDRAIVVAVGDRGKGLAEKVMGARAAGKSPFLVMSYDYGRFLELQAQMSRMMGTGDPDVAAMVDQELNEGLAKLFGRAAATLDVNDKGLVFWASIEMK